MTTAAGASSPEKSARRRVVQVALPLPPRQTFSYRVPGSKPLPAPGCRVRVGFGRRHLIGYVVKDREAVPPEKLRPLLEILDGSPLFPPEVFSFTRALADYYLVSWGTVLKGAYPSSLDPTPRTTFRLGKTPAKRPPRRLAPLLAALEKGPLTRAVLRRRFGGETEVLIQEALSGTFLVEETVWKTRRKFAGRDRVALLARGNPAGSGAVPDPLPRPFAKVLETLKPYQNKGYPSVAEVARAARVPQRVLGEMADTGLVELFDLVPVKQPGVASPHRLTGEQRAAVARIESALEARRHETFLLFGVTGSGKTEVYLRIIQRVLASGGAALYLVPEISLTSYLARRLIERFGSEVAILHSSMTQHERGRQWRRVAGGEARLVIGPRSALFAPLERLGLIVVDEEHDSSYKQQESPRFHARDMAVLRGKLSGVPVVLGSATPSVESYFNAAESGKYTLLTLRERVGDAVLPPVEIVDMRREFKETGSRSVLSRSLASALGTRLAEGHQAILLRNRLGYHTFVLCRKCGRTLQCRDCSVALTYHRGKSELACHYCGRRQGLPRSCPSCGGEYLQFKGEGTEKVEEVLAEAFPASSVERMDGEVARKPGRFDSLWRAFEEGRIQVLVGTQMVAKGLDIPNVTLVGILSADFILGMPDFRASERVFQLITQASGRAGRGRHPGLSIVQSFHTDHYAVLAARDHDYESFYAKDIRYRKVTGYPPAGALARIEFRHRDESRAEAISREAGRELESHGDPAVTILGPVEPALARLEGYHRRHILLKARERQRLRSLLSKLLESRAGRHNGRNMIVEMDPYGLL